MEIPKNYGISPDGAYSPRIQRKGKHQPGDESAARAALGNVLRDVYVRAGVNPKDIKEELDRLDNTHGDPLIVGYSTINRALVDLVQPREGQAEDTERTTFLDGR